MGRSHGQILNPLNCMVKSVVGATLSRPAGRAVARAKRSEWDKRGGTSPSRTAFVPSESLLSRLNVGWGASSKQ